MRALLLLIPALLLLACGHSQTGEGAGAEGVKPADEAAKDAATNALRNLGGGSSE